jgi:hypothetical protein
MFKIDNLENDTRDETLSRQKKDADHIEKIPITLKLHIQHNLLI